MCGIVACYGAARSPNDLRRTLRRSLQALSHRGPDETQVWTGTAGGVGLGHVRLSLVDPRRGVHPVQNEDRSITAIVNGEFYDDHEWRETLETRGHRFRTRTDSEILVHLYEQHGLSCVEFLRGEFAFVLWDQSAQRLFAARDRFGVKPLVYGQSVSGELWLASEAKALFAAGLAAEWDHQTFAQVASHQYPTPERTMFRGIAQLTPGHYLVAQRGAITRRTYWDLDYPVKGAYEPSSDDAERIIADQLADAVRVRLRGDVPVAFYLSGGLDSSAVLSLAARYNQRRLHAFGIAFDHHAYDEHEEAAWFATELGVEFTPVVVQEHDLLEHLAGAVFHAEGLCINGQLVAKYLLSRAVRAAGYKAVMVGEGADEAFLGYAHLEWDYLASVSDTKAGTLDRFRQRYALQAGIMLPSEPHQADTTDRPMPTFLAAKLGIGDRLRPVLGMSFRESLPRTPVDDLYRRFHGQLASRHPVARSSYLWSKLALASYILRTLGDGTEMAHSVEGRVPFLDHRLFEIARRVSPAHHLGGGAKSLLRRAMKGVLPKRIQQRAKRPLLAPPIDVSTNSQSRDRIMDIIAGQTFRAVPFFDVDRVRSWFETLMNQTGQVPQAVEPAVMMVLSAWAMQRTFQLGEGGL